ncbi:MAG: hypothetical protein PHV74_12490 [Dehalococcoidia bacterium]|nr:hypothetical protein [Dehalococcoidia bacterium]
MTEAAVLLLAFVVYMAYRTDETFLWLTAGLYSGLVSPVWWEVETAYGMTAFMVAGICAWRCFSQLIGGDTKF